MAAYAQDNISVVTADGYMPLRVDDRVSFYVTKEYADNDKFPAGSAGMFIMTANCTKMLYKRAVISVFLPTTGEHYNPNKSEDELAHSMLNKEFGAIDAEMLPIVTNMCETVK
jgi:hypothetical protein